MGLAIQLEEADTLGRWVLATLIDTLGSVSKPAVPVPTAPSASPSVSGVPGPSAAGAPSGGGGASTPSGPASAATNPSATSTALPASTTGRRGQRSKPSSTTRPIPSQEALQDWVHFQYTGLLKHLTRQTDRYTSGHLATGLIVIAGGFATSGIAVAAGSGRGSSPAWLIFGIGLAVAVAGGMGQIFRLAQRSVGFGELADLLRAEGWALVNSQDAYTAADVSKTEGSTVFDVFAANVSNIRRQATQLAAIEAPSVSARKGSKGAA